MALCRKVRARASQVRRCRPPAAAPLLPEALVQGAAAVAAPDDSGVFGPSQFPLQLRSLVLRPSFHRRYPASSLLRPLLTSPPLGRESSPGKVQNLSPRAAQLYLTRLGDLWASLFPASLPPASGLTADSCSYGREFATRFFTSRLRLAAHYGCRHRPRSAPFIQQDSAHAGHTRTGLLACRLRMKEACELLAAVE